jgi:hypothetical protein
LKSKLVEEYYPERTEFVKRDYKTDEWRALFNWQFQIANSHRLYWFLFFSSCRSNPSWINFSINAG